MKKKPVDKKLKKFVRDYMFNYRWVLGLQAYDGEIHYMDEPDPDDANTPGVTRASMTTDRRYLRSTVKIFPEFIKTYKSGDIDECKRILAHEMAHVATQHMMDLCTSCYKDEGETKDAWESLTEKIGRLAHELYEYKKK